MAPNPNCYLPSRGLLVITIRNLSNANLLHICPFVGEQLGGSERYVANISEAQAKYCNVSVYTTTRYAQNAGISKSNGVSFYRFYSPFVIWNINPLSFTLRPMLNSKIDIFHIHSHLYFLSNQAILAKYVRKKPALLHIHGGVGLPPYKTSLTRLLVKKIYDRTLGKLTIGKSDIVASVCRQDLLYISRKYKIPEERLRHIPNAIDTEKFRPDGSDLHSRNNDILYVGDFEHWKGVGLLMKWLSKYSKDPTNPPLSIQFVGQGTLFNDLLEFAKRESSQENNIRIEVLGPRSNEEVSKLMRKSRALILPSYWEGMPTVLLESMASGTPTISTSVGEIPAVITDMKTGFLIEHDFKSFLSAITTVIEDERRARDIAGNARNLIVSDYSIPKVARTLLETYAEMLNAE